MQAPIANIAQMIIEEETVRHLFWECNNVRRVIEWIGQELIGGNFEETEFMLGKVRVNNMITELVIVCNHWTKYWIYCIIVKCAIDR